MAGEQEQTEGEGGAGGRAELAEDGSQRVHGARTDPLSLSRTHVSLTCMLCVQRCDPAGHEEGDPDS